MNRKHVWIGTAVLLCLLMNIYSISAATISEGNVTAQDIVTNSWDWYEGEIGDQSGYLWMRGYIKYDCSKLPQEMHFNAYNIRVYKQPAVRWYYDPESPGSDVIPDSIVEIVPLTKMIDLWTFIEVGSVTTTIQKIGSANGPNNDTGYVNILLDITVTNTTLLIGEGVLDLVYEYDGVTPGPVFSFYSSGGAIWNQYTTAANEMYALQGFKDMSDVFLPGGSDPNYQTCLGWTLTSYFNFKNYYEVNTNPTNITVDVQREGGDLASYMVKSKLRSYDQYGLVLSESAWHTTNQTYTLPLVPQTIYLVPDFGDKSTELLIANYQSQDTAKIYGYVYNAENESTITTAKVEISTDGDSHSTYSDDSGFYLIRTDPGNRTLTVSKDGYWDWQETIYFPYAGDYEIDIPLIPKLFSHTGHGILGIVRTLPYYLPVENQAVSIKNASWTTTTNTNNVGYYIFDNLQVGDYWINVSKSGYRNNNQIVTVSAAGDVVVTIDTCDATANWASNNTLSLNNSDKQEGTNSLQSYGKLPLDFSKSVPWTSAINASTIAKKNGYMTFWYKVDNTVWLNDSITFTVGSNGNNATNKISWSVYKANFVDDTWKEVWLKFSEGVETGTLNMSRISWIEVRASKSDNITSKIDDIRFYDFSYEIHDVDLDPVLSLGVIAKTIEGQIISSFSATLDGVTKNTTAGQELIFEDLHYGMKELTVTSQGYIPYQTSIYLDVNKNITAYLQKETEAGVGLYYPPPHLVEFLVQTWQGAPIDDVTITAIGYSTTMGSWDWLWSVFGYKNETQIQNTTMTDTTDSIGTVTFMMVETIKYKVTFVKESQGINETLYVYPKDDQYIITIWWAGTPALVDTVSWNLSVMTINSTHSALNFTYNDTSNKTSTLTYWVLDINDTLVYNKGYNYPITINTGYVVQKTSGKTYQWGFNATHLTFGYIEQFDALTFKSILWDLQLDNPEYYTWISVTFLLLFTGLFSIYVSKFGYVLIPLFGLFFWWIGWLNVSFLILSSVLILGVLAYMTRRERETGL